jgi:hypothetical protein
MLDQILKLVVAELGTDEFTAGLLVRTASKPLTVLLLRVAADHKNPQAVSERRLGRWFAEHRGRAAAGWKIEGRVGRDHQMVWRIAEAPLDVEQASVPAAPAVMPMDRTDLSPAQKLEANLSTALDRQAEVMALGVDRDNLKQTRLVAETASSTVNAALKAQENALQRPRGDNLLPEIIQALREEKAKLAASGHVEPPRDAKREALMMIRATHLFSREEAAKALTELSEEDRAEVMADAQRLR